MSGINYINHHKNVNAKMISDESISTIDIAIYNALFLLWNSNGFCTTLSISRSEVMQLSKVGNANTYTSSLKRLDSLGYIKYMPSNSPLVGSKITIIRYDTTGGKSSDITGGKAADNSSDSSSGLSGDTLYKHYNTLTQEHIETLFSYLDSLTESEIQSKINEFVKSTKKQTSKVSPIIKTKRTIEERKKVFYDKIATHINDYSKEMLRDFFEYWSEHGEDDHKMKYEKQKSFDINLRLKKWNNNNFNSKPNGTNNKTQPTADEKLNARKIANRERLMGKFGIISEQTEL